MKKNERVAMNRPTRNLVLTLFASAAMMARMISRLSSGFCSAVPGDLAPQWLQN